MNGENRPKGALIESLSPGALVGSATINTTLVAFHGADDAVVPLEYAENRVKMLRMNSGKRVTWRVLEGEGHSISSNNGVAFVYEALEELAKD